MTDRFNIVLRLSLIYTVLFSSIIAHGQPAQAALWIMRSPAAQSTDALAVSLEMQNEHVPTGQEPWAIVNIENICGEPVVILDSMYRVYVDGKHGEAPTTLVQRQFTDRLRASDAPLRSDQNFACPTVWPGQMRMSWTHHPIGGSAPKRSHSR